MTLWYNDHWHPLHKQQRSKQSGSNRSDHSTHLKKRSSQTSLPFSRKQPQQPLQSAYRARHSTETVFCCCCCCFLLNNNNIYGTPSRNSPERLQRHKNALISSHTLTRTRARKCKLMTFSPPWTMTFLFVLSLDISAAFDTIDHQFLYSLHISDRYQSTSVNNSSLSSPQFMYGLP